MTDAHAAPAAHGAAPAGGHSPGDGCKTDNWYDKIAAYVSEQVSTFVAFMFFLITVGAVYGALVAAKNPTLEPILIIAPAVLGLVAFYNRDISTLFFIVFVVAFIIV